MANDFGHLKAKICNNIVNYRKKLGLTQVQLSINCGATDDYIYRIEKGKRMPSVERLYNIAKALKVDITELFR